jgi:D-alanyl-D-alanine carboxypeptidase (penicillin-binding protein 5/6)
MESYHLRYPVNKTGKHSHMKRRLIVMCTLLVILAGSLYTYAALTKPLPALDLHLNTLPTAGNQSNQLMWPGQGQAAIGSLQEGVLATSSDTQTASPIASIAKVITALAVLQKKPMPADGPGETLTLNANDVALYEHYVAVGGSNAKVTDGETITQYEAFEALMLPSANNMADTLAIWAFGSIDAYKTYASNMLKDFGLTHTTIADASGFSPQTMSIPSDLIIIGQKALLSPVLKAIMNKPEATIPVAGTIQNVNKLLGQDNIIGIKTGNTNEAGGCLLFAATHTIAPGQTTIVIGAVTGATDLEAAFGATRMLLGSAEKGFAAITVVPKDTVIGSYQTPWGSKTNVVAAHDLVAYGWQGRAYQTKITSKDFQIPLAARSNVGSVALTGANAAQSEPVVIQTALTKPSLVWRLFHYF